MKKKPILIYILSLLHLIMPVWYILQITLIFKKNIFDISSYDSGYTLILCCWSILVAIGIFLVSKWGFFLYIGYTSWTIISYVIIMIRGVKVPFYLISIGIFSSILAITLPFLFKHIFSPFFNPRLRWWKVPPRFYVQGSEEIKSVCTPEECRIYDVNIHGCYLTGNFFKIYKTGQIIDFELYIKDQKFNVSGQIVWMNSSEEKSQKPIGMGVKFVNLQGVVKEDIHKILQELKKEGKLTR